MFKQLSFSLLVLVSAGQVSANTEITEGKKLFDGKINTLTNGLKKSITQMEQGRQYLVKSRQGIQKKQQEPNLTQPQKQCLVAVLDRTNRSYSMVQRSMNTMNQHVRQLHMLKTQIQKSSNKAQLEQVGKKGNEIIQQVNGLYKKNFEVSREWDKRVQNVCSKAAKK